LLPGFVGHNVADRKQIEARKSFAQRLGESDKDAFCVELTHDELQTKVDHWLEVKYNHKPHRGLNGKSPFEVMAAWSAPVRRIENERALDILLAPVAGKDGQRAVTKHGIALDHAKFIHPNLVPGTQVLCRHDPSDLGRIYVFSSDGREFICIAECPERVGVNPGDAIRAVRAEQTRRIKEEVDPLRREIGRMKPFDMIDGVLRANEAQHGTLTAFPSRVAAHTTPSLDAAARALPREPKETPLSQQQEQVHERVIERLADHRQPEPENTPETRFARARAIEADLHTNAVVSITDRQWLQTYLSTAEYRAHRRMEDSFKARSEAG